MNRSRMLWRNAKRKFLQCRHKLKSLIKNVPKSSVPAVVTLDDVVMEEILKRLDLSERVRMRVLSRRVHDIVDRMPLILPFIFIRSDARGNIELHCDYMDVLLDYVLADMQGFKVVNGAIAFNHTNARSVLTAIISRITGVTHLWLDSAWNGHIMQTIVEYYQAINSGSKRLRILQVDSTLSIEDSTERSAILRALSTMPENGVLEVIHICHGTVTDTAKVIGYWIQLARDSSREIKLKLEECSQERADAAVGRLLRKARGVACTEWTRCGIALRMGDGRLTVLDKKAWFGDDDQ
ncbi:unnamed protein product [Strongylus vulgaris]|uniref:F-box domain-containing protein n=1 Tax=Strongylus vulgaris TaxID=40348 RepID=A0A3P7J6I4_STRVU|nr:unnamed protein product [Strongylus vulgaris]